MSERVPIVWVDADSCPVAVRDLLIKWETRGRISLDLLANRVLPVPDSVTTTVVERETVDEHICARLDALDAERQARVVIVTRDIPLAERCTVGYRCSVINDRGTASDPETARERRSIRDAAETIRADGLETIDRRRRYDRRDLKRFADTLDRLVATWASGEETCRGNDSDRRER